MPSVMQSALDPAGIHAARIEDLWWLMFWVSAAVWTLVMIALGLALVRGRAGRATEVPERRLIISVGAATAVSIVALIGLLTASVLTGRATVRAGGDQALIVKVTAHQWWWDVEYVHDEPSRRVRSANELHLPVGRPVAIEMKSADVIHSFWVPALHGKTDLIPGRATTTWIVADRPGTWRGQCGEYCGLQHAHMALVVMARPPEEFDVWLEAQRAVPPEPTSALEARGRDIVEQGPCALCHRVAGTTAGGRTGPDLTHFASRATIAAGTVPNTRANLERWLADPQALKPGNRMPATGLGPEDVRAVAAYLDTLR